MSNEPSTEEIERAQVYSLRRLGMLALDIATRLDIPLTRVKSHLAKGPRRFQRSAGVGGPVTSRQYAGRF